MRAFLTWAGLAIGVSAQLSKRTQPPCSPLALGSGPVSSVDTDVAFLNNPSISNAALNAQTPTGWNLVFQNLQAATSGASYIGYKTYTSYDPSQCAADCSTTSGCLSFNIFFERDPTLLPGTACTNPASTTNIKCSFWSVDITKDTATNVGQMMNDFHVVNAGSNGYTCGGSSTTTTTTVAPTTATTTANWQQWTTTSATTVTSSPVTTTTTTTVATTTTSSCTTSPVTTIITTTTTTTVPTTTTTSCTTSPITTIITTTIPTTTTSCTTSPITTTTTVPTTTAPATTIPTTTTTTTTVPTTTAPVTTSPITTTNWQQWTTSVVITTTPVPTTTTVPATTTTAKTTTTSATTTSTSPVSTGSCFRIKGHGPSWIDGSYLGLIDGQISFGFGSISSAATCYVDKHGLLHTSDNSYLQRTIENKQNKGWGFISHFGTEPLTCQKKSDFSLTIDGIFGDAGLFWGSKGISGVAHGNCPATGSWEQCTWSWEPCSCPSGVSGAVPGVWPLASTGSGSISGSVSGSNWWNPSSWFGSFSW